MEKKKKNNAGSYFSLWIAICKIKYLIFDVFGILQSITVMYVVLALALNLGNVPEAECLHRTL